MGQGLKWAKGGWPLPLPVSGLHRAAPGAVQNVLQGCLPVRGSRNTHQLQLHPGSSHSCTPSSTWEGTQKEPGVLLLQQVCPRALCGVWEVRVRTPGGAHVSVAGRAAPTLRLAWGLSWVRLKGAQGAAQGGSAQLHPPFIINLLLSSVGLASLSPPSKFHLEDQENLHPSVIFSSPLIMGFQQQFSPELKFISPGPMYLPPLWASGCYPHVQTVPRDVDFLRKTRMILEGKCSAISIKGPFQL